jgi:hypothetical protein
MTDFEENNVRCFCCTQTSRQPGLLGSNEFGSRDLDQRPAEMMRSTMGSWLQECPNCGYVSADLAKGDEHERCFVLTRKHAALRNGPHFSRLSARFLVRAASDAARGDFEQAFADTLCAAWDADDRDLDEVARALRKTAISYLAGRSFVSVDLRLKLLDVHRRARNWAGATALAEQIMARKLEHPFSAIVGFQLGKINSRDDGCYTVSQASALPPDPSKPEHLEAVIHALPQTRRGRS